MKENKKLFGFDKKKLQNWYFYWSVFAVGFVLLMFFITSTWIGIDVRERCKLAQSEYQGDCVESLIQVVDDEENNFTQRNQAIWALAQMGDQRSLEVLNKYYTGNVPDREKYDAGLSQYELQKAIKMSEGGFNITKLIWQIKE